MPHKLHFLAWPFLISLISFNLCTRRGRPFVSVWLGSRTLISDNSFSFSLFCISSPFASLSFNFKLCTYLIVACMFLRTNWYASLETSPSTISFAKQVNSQKREAKFFCVSSPRLFLSLWITLRLTSRLHLGKIYCFGNSTWLEWRRYAKRCLQEMPLNSNIKHEQDVYKGCPWIQTSNKVPINK